MIDSKSMVYIAVMNKEIVSVEVDICRDCVSYTM